MSSEPATLRVGIDARDILLAHRTGVERVLYQLLLHLPAAAPEFEYVLFVHRDGMEGTPHRDLDVLRARGYRLVIEPIRYARLQKVFDIWLAWQIRPLLEQYRIAVLYSVNSKFALASVPAVTTIHGVEWHGYPDGYRLLERCKQWAWFQLATRLSRGIVTFAEHTRQDVLRMRPDCSIPIVTVPEGVATEFRVLSEAERDPAVLARYGVRAPYILSVCSLVPRKNIDGLLRAFAKLTTRCDIPHQLVLIGKSAWKSERLHDLVDRLALSERVVFTGYVSDTELIQFYNQAALFAYPSKYEGFGLPPLEAMRCGVPVVTADRSATREVGRGAAILVNPDDDDSLADGIYRGLTDRQLRAELIDAGLQRAGLYTWEKMAREIAHFLKRVGRTQTQLSNQGAV